MKMDRVANSGNDEFYTPLYAVKPIEKYLKKGAKIWCPFDTSESIFVRYFRRMGYKVVCTHLSTGQDFFNTSPSDVGGCDYIISNPPYSVKGEVLSRLFSFGVPFAMLVGVVGLFESQTRFSMFRDNQFEVMYFNKRISYMNSYGAKECERNPPFSSVYLCSGMLPKQICFEEVDKSLIVLPKMKVLRRE